MRHAIAVLITLSTLVYLNSAQAAFEPPAGAARVQVPAIQVEAALTRWGWRVSAAQEYARIIPVFIIDLSYLREQGFSVNALLIEECPALNSKIYIDVNAAKQHLDIYSNYIWHEFQHLIEYAPTCEYAYETMLQDASVLSQTEFVETYKLLASQGRVDALSHFNHNLAALINYQYYTLPDIYRNKYFWWAVSPTPTPIPAAIRTPNAPMMVSSCSAV